MTRRREDADAPALDTLLDTYAARAAERDRRRAQAELRRIGWSTSVPLAGRTVMAGDTARLMDLLARPDGGVHAPVTDPAQAQRAQAHVDQHGRDVADVAPAPAPPATEVTIETLPDPVMGGGTLRAEIRLNGAALMRESLASFQRQVETTLRSALLDTSHESARAPSRRQSERERESRAVLRVAEEVFERGMPFDMAMEQLGLRGGHATEVAHRLLDAVYFLLTDRSDRLRYMRAWEGALDDRERRLREREQAVAAQALRLPEAPGVRGIHLREDKP